MSKPYFIMKITSDDYGHCNYCDVIELNNGMVVTLSFEGLCLHPSLKAWNDGEDVVECVSFPDGMELERDPANYNFIQEY